MATHQQARSEGRRGGGAAQQRGKACEQRSLCVCSSQRVECRHTASKAALAAHTRTHTHSTVLSVRKKRRARFRIRDEYRRAGCAVNARQPKQALPRSNSPAEPCEDCAGQACRQTYLHNTHISTVDLRTEHKGKKHRRTRASIPLQTARHPNRASLLGTQDATCLGCQRARMQVCLPQHATKG